MIGRLHISKQFYNRKRFEKKQFMKIINNMMINDPIIPTNLYFNKNNQGKNKTNSIFNSKCRFTGRSKANFNKFKMSRMVFKQFGENGYLNGLKKSSW